FCSTTSLPLLCLISLLFFYSLFFFNHTATPEIHTLSLHDALPILRAYVEASSESMLDETFRQIWQSICGGRFYAGQPRSTQTAADRKSTRLNSSHLGISYAVFCLKKKNKN